MSMVWRVGFPDHDESAASSLEHDFVGLLNVERESVIVITDDGDVELFYAEGISEKNLLQAQVARDKIMFLVNGS